MCGVEQDNHPIDECGGLRASKPSPVTLACAIPAFAVFIGGVVKRYHMGSFTQGAMSVFPQFICSCPIPSKRSSSLQA